MWGHLFTLIVQPKGKGTKVRKMSWESNVGVQGDWMGGPMKTHSWAAWQPVRAGVSFPVCGHGCHLKLCAWPFWFHLTDRRTEVQREEDTLALGTPCMPFWLVCPGQRGLKLCKRDGNPKSSQKFLPGGWFSWVLLKRDLWHTWKKKFRNTPGTVPLI